VARVTNPGMDARWAFVRLCAVASALAATLLGSRAALPQPHSREFWLSGENWLRVPLLGTLCMCRVTDKGVCGAPRRAPLGGGSWEKSSRGLSWQDYFFSFDLRLETKWEKLRL
jgi:hypothetical protein